MCRSRNERDGGKRCPSDHNRAKRNAARRAAYKLKVSEAKGAASILDGEFPDLSSYSTITDSELTTETLAAKPASIFGDDFPDLSAYSTEPELTTETPVKKPASIFGDDFPDLNPYSTAMGGGTEQGLTSLPPAPIVEDEEAVTVYGFQPQGEVRSGKTPADIREESVQEVRYMTREQGKAVAAFTGPDFRWINGAIYGKRGVLRLPGTEHNPELAETKRPSWSGDVNNFRSVTRDLDSAFLDAPLKERVVYRGKNISAGRFNTDKTTIDEYVDENYAVGSEVVFDGYQSASLEPKVAVNFSGEKGIIFEMKSQTGVSVSSLSHFDFEAEVLLPRSTRWKVVGVTKDAEFVASKSDNFGFKDLTSLNRVTIVQMVEVDSEGNQLTERTAPPPITDEMIQKSLQI